MLPNIPYKPLKSYIAISNGKIKVNGFKGIEIRLHSYNPSYLTHIYQRELSNLIESNIPSADFSADAPPTRMRQSGLRFLQPPNHASQRAARPGGAQGNKSRGSLNLRPALGWRTTGFRVSRESLLRLFFVAYQKSEPLGAL